MSRYGVCASFSTKDSIMPNETKVILSFAMAQHGGQFAHWLRDKLMKHYDFYGRNSVYMDCVAVRGLKSEHSAEFVLDADRQAGTTYVFPDKRPVFEAQGYKPIGAVNSNWDGMYKDAMAQASVMIMVITPSYLASQWCLQEWAQLQQERKRRPGLKGIGIRFWDNPDLSRERLKDPNGKPLNQEGIEYLICAKTKGGAGKGLLWHPDDWGISDMNLGRLYNMVGNI